MTTIRSSREPARSRRRFLKVAVMASAAAVASSALAGAGEAASAPRKRSARPKPAAERPAALEAEIAKQKHSTSDLLKAIRDHELPPGSEMAFAFVPARAPKRAPRSGAAPAGGGAR